MENANDDVKNLLGTGGADKDPNESDKAEETNKDQAVPTDEEQKESALDKVKHFLGMGKTDETKPQDDSNPTEPAPEPKELPSALDTLKNLVGLGGADKVPDEETNKDQTVQTDEEPKESALDKVKHFLGMDNNAPDSTPEQKPSALDTIKNLVGMGSNQEEKKPDETKDETTQIPVISEQSEPDQTPIKQQEDKPKSVDKQSKRKVKSDKKLDTKKKKKVNKSANPKKTKKSKTLVQPTESDVKVTDKPEEKPDEKPKKETVETRPSWNPSPRIIYSRYESDFDYFKDHPAAKKKMTKEAEKDDRPIWNVSNHVDDKMLDGPIKKLAGKKRKFVKVKKLVDDRMSQDVLDKIRAIHFLKIKTYPMVDVSHVKPKVDDEMPKEIMDKIRPIRIAKKKPQIAEPAGLATEDKHVGKSSKQKRKKVPAKKVKNAQKV